MLRYPLRTSVAILCLPSLAIGLAVVRDSMAGKPPKGGGGTSRIAYFAFGSSLEGYPNTYQIWTMTPSGSGKAQATRIPAQHMAPNWSSDGRLISCSQIPFRDGQFINAETSLRIVNPRSGDWYDIVNTPANSRNGYHVSTYALWSDYKVNGARLAAEDQLLLVEADSADGAQNFFVLQPDPAGSNLRAITFYPDRSPLNQRYIPSNAVWLSDAADGSARVAYFERWVQGADPFTDSNDNDLWDVGEPYTDANGDGEFTPFEELAFEPRVVTLASGSWPLVDVASNDSLPSHSALPPDVNRPEFLFWNQSRTVVAWFSDGPGCWLAPVLYDGNGNPGIDWDQALAVTPGTYYGGFGTITFSPDGQRFAFNDYVASNAFFNHIYAINIDGSALKDLTRSGSGTWGEFFGQNWGPIGSGD